MKKLLTSILVILAFVTISFGKFALISLGDSFKSSEFIVIGELTSVSTQTEGDYDVSTATLKIEKVIVGELKTVENKFLQDGDKTIVKWRNSNLIACRFSHPANEKGIWLLSIGEDGFIDAGRGSFVGLDRMKDLKKLLKTEKLKITTKLARVEDNKSVFVSTTSFEEKPIENQTFIEQKPLNNSENNSLLKALLVFIIALILYRLLYRARFKIKVRKEKKEKSE